MYHTDGGYVRRVIGFITGADIRGLRFSYVRGEGL